MTNFKGLLVLAALTGLVACDDGTDTGETGDTETTCENAIEGLTPADGATDVIYTTDVRVTFEEEDSATMLSLASADGDVAGATSNEGSTYIFTPDAPLMPSTEYTVTIENSCGELESKPMFTTSDLGEPVADPSTLVDNTYLVDITGGDWLKPPGIGSVIGGLLDGVDLNIFVGVFGYDAGMNEITMIGALGSDESTQDECSPSIAFNENPADFSENPYFSIETDELSIDAGLGDPIVIGDVTLGGVFASDGSELAGVTLAGTLDARDLSGIIPPELGDPCTLLVTFGVACEECSDGEDQCLSVEVANIEGDFVNGLTLVEIDQSDIDANPNCAEAAAE